MQSKASDIETTTQHDHTNILNTHVRWAEHRTALCPVFCRFDTASVHEIYVQSFRFRISFRVIFYIFFSPFFCFFDSFHCWLPLPIAVAVPVVHRLHFVFIVVDVSLRSAAGLDAVSSGLSSEKSHNNIQVYMGNAIQLHFFLLFIEYCYGDGGGQGMVGFLFSAAARYKKCHTVDICRSDINITKVPKSVKKKSYSYIEFID